MDKKDSGTGTFLAVAGVLILTPDTLLMRWVGLDAWPLASYRGLMLGLGMLIIYLITRKRMVGADWKPLGSWLGLSVVIAFGSNSITFTLGITETSVTIVLTALATTPLAAAILSIFILKEKITLATTLTILSCFIGVTLVMTGSAGAIGAPGGNPFLGGLFGLLTACGWAYTLVICRLRADINMIPVAATGALLSGTISFFLAPSMEVDSSRIPWLLLMGFAVLPLSFSLLTFAPRYAPAATVSLIMLLEAVLGPFWVWLGTGEQPSVQMMLGTLVVILSLAAFLLYREKYRKTSQGV